MPITNSLTHSSLFLENDKTYKLESSHGGSFNAQAVQ